MTVGESKAGTASYASERVFGGIPLEATSVKDGSASAQIPNCPNHCKTGKIYRDGLRYNLDGSTSQRYLCTCCGQRFSDKPLRTSQTLDSSCQICAEEAKNLHVPKRKHYGTGELSDEVKAVIKVFEGWLKKEGYKESRYPNDLKTLAYLGADLNNPESVKTKIGEHNVSDSTKLLLTYAYDAFCKMNKVTWERPYYTQDDHIPFVPDETEIDQCIAAATHRLATFLRLLKETYADPGEAIPIQWIELTGRIVNINHPVKDHFTGQYELSEELVAMIHMLPKTTENIFGRATYQNMCDSFLKLRKKLYAKTKNERFLHLDFTSIRTWGGTMLAEMTGDVFVVMQWLRHRRVENSMKYINRYKLSLKSKATAEWEYLAVKTEDELKIALLGGYKFEIEKFGASWFRRPKRVSFNPTSGSQQCQPSAEVFNKRETDLVRL